MAASMHLAVLKPLLLLSALMYPLVAGTCDATEMAACSAAFSANVASTPANLTAVCNVVTTFETCLSNACGDTAVPTDQLSIITTQLQNLNITCSESTTPAPGGDNGAATLAIPPLMTVTIFAFFLVFFLGR